jgi:hypothetical protein
VSGSLPAGLSLSTAGVLGGTPTTAATSNFTVQAISGAQSATQALSVTVTATVPTLTIVTANLPDGAVGTAYMQTLQATGGIGIYAWSVVSGSLPPGLTLSSAGVLSGMPTVAATSNFTLQVTSGTQTVSQALVLTIGAVVPDVVMTRSSLLPNVAISGEAYSFALGATGGTGTYLWSILSGSLPPGLSLSTGGIISGVPLGTCVGCSYTFLPLVTSGGKNGGQGIEIDVAAPLQFQTFVGDSLKMSGRVGAAFSWYHTAMYGAGSARGADASYVWSVANGSLPPGLSLSTSSNTGSIVGTPTTTGSYSFALQIHSGSEIVSEALTIEVSNPVITTANLPDGAVGQQYSDTLQATGGVEGYAWTVASGSLPPGLSLSSAGILSGTPSSSTSASFTLKVASGIATATQTFTLHIFPALLITTTTLPSAQSGQPYTFANALHATGGNDIYGWSVIAGSLPTGLVLSYGGVINGTPTSFGTDTFTVQVVSGIQTTTAILGITIYPADLAIVTSPSLPSGTLGTPYLDTLKASGGTGSYSWSLQPTAFLPAGLSLSSAGVLSGILSNNPTDAHLYGFTLQVVSGTHTLWQNFTLQVNLPAAAAAAGMTSLFDDTIGTLYGQTFQPTGRLSILATKRR